MSTEQEKYWQAHYDRLAAQGTGWLDYGNARVQAQSHALALEAAEPLQGVACVDIGCGRGQLAQALRERGAAHVTGADLSPQLVDQLRAEQADGDWRVYSLLADPQPVFGRRFDRVLAIEVLQYVPLVPAMAHLWDLVAPGGRLVAIVPNRDCPFLAAALARFAGRYAPPSAVELVAALQALPHSARSRIDGMWYTQAADGPPYRVARLESVARDGAPNRFIFTADKALSDAAR